MFKENHQRFLKVKIKSLAAESKIIRHEEKKTRYSLREALYLHRVLDVRQETRAALLAYTYLRGRPMCAAESSHSKGKNEIFGRVLQIVKKFGTLRSVAGFEEWFREEVRV